MALVSCGGGATPPPSDVVVPVASASAAPLAAPAAPARRGPTEAILKYWTFDSRAHLVVYADLGGLLRTELGRAVVPAVLALAKGSLSADQEPCIQRASEAVQDVAVGADDDGGLLIARIDDSAFQMKPCMAAAGATPASVEGAPEAFATGDSVVAHLPGVLLLGPKRNVELALKPRSAPAAFPSAVSLGQDEYVAWSVVAEEGIQGQGTLLASSDRFRIRMEGDLPAPFAKHVEKEWQTRKDEAASVGSGAQEIALLKKLIDAVKLERDGGHLTASFDLHETAVDQARDLGALAGLGTFAVRRYLADSKLAEARNTLGQIAKDYAAWYEREDGTPKARKRFASLPAVPKAIPHGVKYASTPADWKRWEPIRFEMDAPQYYQYEVKASKDGSSADIFARGDLDGNGKTSELVLHVAIDRKQGVLAIGPSITEHDAME
jgi:hypothetical protein